MPPKRKEPIDAAKQIHKRAKKDETDDDNGEIEDNSAKVCLPSVDKAAGENLTDHNDETNAVSCEENIPKDVNQTSEDDKEASDSKFQLPHPTVAGELLISGGTDWDLIGRKEIPKNTEIVQNGVAPRRSSGRPRKSSLLTHNTWDNHDFSLLKREVDSHDKKLCSFYWTKYSMDAGRLEMSQSIRRQRTQYSDVQRQAILDYLNKDGATIRSTAKAFNIPKSTIHDMKKIKTPLLSDEVQNRRKAVTRSQVSQVFDVKKDEGILKWIAEQHTLGQTVLPEKIMIKAKEVYTDDEKINRLWVKKFVERYEGIIGKPKIQSGKKVLQPQLLTEVDYFKSVLRNHIMVKNISRKLVGNMQELPISFNYTIGNDPKHIETHTSLTTPADETCHVTVVMTAMADGKLLAPMVIFKGKDVVNLTIPPGFVVTVQEKPCMNENLMFAYIEHVWQPYVKKIVEDLELPCSHAALLLDDTESHTSEEVNSILEKSSVFTAIFPEGSARAKIVPLNILINKFFKAIMLSVWSNYVKDKIEVRKHPLVDGGVEVHVPLPSEQTLLGWIAEAFEALRNRLSLIRKSFEFCGACVSEGVVSELDILKERNDLLVDLKTLYGDIKLEED